MSLCVTCVNRQPEFFCSFVKRGGNTLDRIGEFCAAYDLSINNEVTECEKYLEIKKHVNVS